MPGGAGETRNLGHSEQLGKVIGRDGHMESSRRHGRYQGLGWRDALNALNGSKRT